MEKISNNERFHHLDGLRVIAMILGIAMHSMLFITPAQFFPWFVQGTENSYFFLAVLFFSHLIRLPLFFFLAGFFASFSIVKSGLWHYLFQRLIRLGIPFILGLLIMAPLHIAEFSFFNQGISINRIHFQQVLYYLGFTGPLWFLYYLLLMNGLFVLAYVIMDCLPKVRNYLATGFDHPAKLFRLTIFFAVFLGIILFNKQVINVIPSYTLHVDIFSIAYYMVFFLFGAIVYRNRDHVPLLVKHFRIYFWLALSVFPLLFLLFLGVEQFHWDWSFIWISISGLHNVFVWLFIISLLGITYEYLYKENRIIRYLSQASYWFYLMQVPVIVLLQSYFIHHGHLLLLKFLCVFFSSFVLLWLSYEFFIKHTFIRKII